MDWYPLFNSLRIALISCGVVFFTGIFAAYYVARLPRAIKGVLDVILTLPMVLPPTVVGYFLLLLLGTRRPLGQFFGQFGIRLVMNWYSAIFASIVVAFPLMYRTARGAFESFDEDLADAARTLGLSEGYVFWRVRCWPLPGRWASTALPVCWRATRPAGRPPLQPPSISFGVPITKRLPCNGCWWMWRSRRWCCWR